MSVRVLFFQCAAEIIRGSQVFPQSPEKTDSQTDRQVEEDGEEIYLARLSGVFRARQQTECRRTTFHICPQNHLLLA